MNNIVLIGMPSAGKSTIGVLLAKTLGMQFIDTDLVIQQKEKRLLQDIINTDGIVKFLEIEESCILSIECRNAVISTGGSAVYSYRAMEHLKRNGTVFYLKVEYEEIVKRINNIKTRGIVLNKGQRLVDIYNERLPLYNKYSDKTIECTDKNIEEILDVINEITKNK